MPVFLKDGRAVLFAHVPKTGGTSLERLFGKSGWTMHLRASRRSDPDTFDLIRCSPQHYHATLLGELLHLDRFDARFLVVRDPIARFRSEYVMRHGANARNAAPQVLSWWRWARARYDEDPFVHDNHLRPQTEFLLPDAEVYRLEDGLERVVADLNARFDLGLEGRLPRASHSRRVGVSSDDVEVSPVLAAELADFYRADFERFGYPRPTG